MKKTLEVAVPVKSTAQKNVIPLKMPSKQMTSLAQKEVKIAKPQQP